jgi:chorismate lyase/3-hydroxybenzoate synthase
MRLFSPNPTTLERRCPRDVPGWVWGLFDLSDRAAAGSTGLTVSSDGAWSLTRAVIADADAMDDDTIRRQTQRAYDRLLSWLRDSPAPFPVRGWNAIPAIGRVQQRGRDRYMAFNIGRHDAYQSFFAGRGEAGDAMPTASAIGHDGADLTIALLGHRQPGRAIENPRQVPAFRYSARYGPTPPSFVRGTVLPPEHDVRRVLVAGTASVVGEDSKHAGDLDRQLAETYRNLAAVLFAVDQGDAQEPSMTAQQVSTMLARYRSARVYVRRAQDMQAVSDSIRNKMIGLEELELVQADICRPELLVEIEGVATLAGADTDA